ncbi:AI-2E family transporter [Peribacillus asahii]|uniref:AI-2E family transporter n=1 Tax=Peribacillus asahii TaxID=228899 RepID=UPI00207A3732|nr:AI-2E family transporter [Peribacillus asahii]USK70754.1 AI-2E family transporter [Peribacillus asahii]
MFKSKLHFWTFELLMIAVLIFVSTKISFLFEPIGIFITTLFFPILIAGFLFFLFNPIVTFLTKGKVPKGLAILLIYVVSLSLIGLLIGLLGPSLSKQVTELINDIPGYFNESRKFIEDMSETMWFKWTMEQDYVSLEEIGNTLQNYLTTLPSNITNSLSSIFSVATNITLVIVTVPFILFYMLKDGHKFSHALLRFVPKGYRKSGLVILRETMETLATYIQGQLLVCFFVGVGTFIGYLIIDLPYAILFALICAITNIIPYVGPFLGGAPAFVIALIHSPTQAVLVIVVITIVQQLDGNLISPLVIGKKLNTHPLTIIILLLVAGNLAGVLGMILAVPTYSVVKTIVLNIVKFIKLRKKEQDEEILE